MDWQTALAKSLTRLIVDLPFGVLLIRFWVWGGAFDLFELPAPNWKQSLGIAVLIVLISH